MKKIPLFFVFAAFVLCPLFVNAQKSAPDYKISNIKLVPFEQITGEFEEEIEPNDERSFFNDLGKALFVTVEISGKAGDYEGKRTLEVTVLEGKKIKLKKVYMSGILNESGKFYFPVWLDAPMCSEIKIKAKILGQKTPAIMTRKVAFQLGQTHHF